MRYRLLDILCCPDDGHFPLELTVRQDAPAEPLAAAVPPCRQFCGWKSQEVDIGRGSCQRCYERVVVEAVLHCESCRREFPISDGIPRMMAKAFAEADEPTPGQRDHVEWVRAEQEWWEVKHSAQGPGQVGVDLRTRIAARHLFGPLRRLLPGSVMVEVGCGTAPRARTLYDPEKMGYYYVGADVALKALQGAMVNGDLVQASVEEMPLRPESCDIVLSQGVLHHTAGKEREVRRLARLLRPGGVLALHEGVCKPHALPQVLRRLVFCQHESPHEERIDASALRAACLSEGQLVYNGACMSSLLMLFVRVGSGALRRSTALTDVALLADSMVIRYLSWLFSPLGAGELYLIVQRSGAPGP